MEVSGGRWGGNAGSATAPTGAAHRRDEPGRARRPACAAPGRACGRAERVAGPGRAGPAGPGTQSLAGRVNPGGRYLPGHGGGHGGKARRGPVTAGQLRVLDD